MSTWDDYPATYRHHHVQAILEAVRAGESASLVGLSGAGKSNLLGFIAHRPDASTTRLGQRFVLIDCNRLAERAPAALFQAIRLGLEPDRSASHQDEWIALEVALSRAVSAATPVAVLLDRFDDILAHTGDALPNNLRALRDGHKYALTYVTATRHPLSEPTELAELLYANTIWLGPLSDDDARWNVARYAARKGLDWDAATTHALVQASRGYPSLLRSCCEAHAAGAALDVASLAEHAAVKARIVEFWADRPTDDEIRLSGLAEHPLLARGPRPAVDTTQLTAKEHLLLRYLQSRAGEVCDKDDIIRAVWPEDKVLERGIRDDSLAQLVRRLREKIESDPATPRRVLTAPGRGYRFIK